MSYYVLFNVMALIGELCLKKNKKDRAQDYSLSKEVSKLEKKLVASFTIGWTYALLS